ncbi:MAG: cyclic nucleotide-binding domain-containing protein, partial [Acidobacteriota bacterium]
MAEKTLFRLSIQHQDRWSTFDAGSGIVLLSEKLSAAQMQEYEIFKEFRESFLERISPDVTVATWKKGSVLFEEGSYIDLAFFVLEGEVELCLKAGQGQAEASSPIFETQRSKPKIQAPEDDIPAAEKTVYFSKTQLQDSNQIAFLSSLDFDLPPGDVMRLGAGEFFGEIGALNGWPQSVTAQTASDCVLIQVRVPALRRMKEKSTEFKKRIDTLYRKRSLFRQLKASPLFSSCSDNFLAGLAKKVKLVSCQPDEAVVKEGTRAESLYLVRSGFVKISQQLGEGQQVLSYLSKGMSFGEAELLFPELEDWTCSYSSVGYSELVQFSSSDLKKAVEAHPEIE